MTPVTAWITTPATVPAQARPIDSPVWQSLLQARGRGWTSDASGSAAAARAGSAPSAAADIDEAALDALYRPLCAATGERGFVVAHLAQSLDGRIATLGGVSRWLSGEEDLLHAHRMRALADAVLVGANTVLLDDPQLTVRHCVGRHPVRVVIDPEMRLDGTQRVFTDASAPTLVVVAADRAGGRSGLGGAEVLAVERAASGELDPMAIRRALAARGLRWLFIEGGGTTVSRFLRAGALDRLQLTIAPVILGSGRPAIELPVIEDLRDSLRPATRRFRMGDDTMIECVFRE